MLQGSPMACPRSNHHVQQLLLDANNTRASDTPGRGDVCDRSSHLHFASSKNSRFQGVWEFASHTVENATYSETFCPFIKAKASPNYTSGSETMAQQIPKTAKQWSIVGTDGLDSLVYSEELVPEIGDTQVLVRIQGASLNFRDLLIAQGKYPWPVKPNVVPGSDGAGTVLAAGKHVTRFQPGDKVITTLNQKHISGSLDAESLQYGTGASIDGTLRCIGVFDEHALVHMPEGLSFVEAATLSCAGVTAWNALFGLPGKRVAPGQWVLTQGTGGVSIFALQFAKAVGARVIATTSAGENKVELLRRLGADHVINYREVEEWGVAAKEITGGTGVDLVVEVAGGKTLNQSVEAVKLDGTIAVLGFVGGEAEATGVPTLLQTWMRLFTARGLWVGSRDQMEEMCRAIEGDVDQLRPVVDRVFKLEELKEAYEYLLQGKHQGKVGIDISA
ncbi:zinc-dependent alcohol dehydrogenase family protein [Aspergillus lucknowensis]|uniref:Zinc-binding dehydrogenase n=1 Tax=Aspergillus lucknowensis TaxID=176173 RepID=A0ABR4LSN8_9EURO